ncbi:DUF1570 domain-containing protein [Allorhodopirellula heiligendammensis]|uniref:DUF1570 domain-containing protein n=1 Tax=Allorhodopirellula heiligendammensis TaxID=2714739 RepID=A0A5C6C6E3_9BACT|nr:DUF1570 domain-containing protein [Allorhodopirellula heiligendammensis]TWU19622.1 hypothetical protein Poly21_17970 [Allorhodopirellula heiligendammensis]
MLSQRHLPEVLTLASLLLLSPSVLGRNAAAEQFVFRDLVDGQVTGEKHVVNGEAVVEAVDGGVLVCADDGRIWTIQPDQITHREPGPPPPAISQDEIERRMLEELPSGFAAFRTAHYVILHQGNIEYARDVAMLFESLYRAFFAYWKNQRVDLEVPKYPLVAVVLRDRDEFVKHASAEIGDTAANVIGYYHLASNQMTTYRVPNIERNIATIIHEATHQLAYNCGLQTRFADNPMWVSEGLAMFFESPDLSNPRGWRGVGRINQVNLMRWRKYQSSRPSDSLVTMFADDSRFRSAATAEDAYGESWAFTYFALRTMKQQYIDYLQQLSKIKALEELTGRERIEMIESAFGMTIAELDEKFVTYMRRVR